MEKNAKGEPMIRDGATAPERIAPSESEGDALAYASFPIQKFRLLYSAPEALKHGTLFEELYLPKGVYNNG